jgi:hypothetical protein
LRAKEKRKLKACELVSMNISYALSHWYYWKVGSRRSKQVIFRFSLSEHTHSTPQFTPRRGGEGEPESRCQFLELCFRNYSHPVGLGLSRTKLNRPNSQIPNPCTGTPRTRTASAPSHDELTSQQGRSGELSPARPSRRRRRRVSRRMRGRLGPGRTGGRQGTVWRFDVRVGLAMPASHDLRDAHCRYCLPGRLEQEPAPSERHGEEETVADSRWLRPLVRRTRWERLGLGISKSLGGSGLEVMGFMY